MRDLGLYSIGVLAGCPAAILMSWSGEGVELPDGGVGVVQTSDVPLLADAGIWKKKALLGHTLLTLGGRSVAGRMGTGDIAWTLVNEFNADPF